MLRFQLGWLPRQAVQMATISPTHSSHSIVGLPVDIFSFFLSQSVGDGRRACFGLVSARGQGAFPNLGVSNIIITQRY